MTGMQRDSVVQQSHKTNLTLHAASLLLNPNRSLDSSALMTDLGLSPLVHLYLSSFRLIPKNSDFCARRINIDDAMPV